MTPAIIVFVLLLFVGAPVAVVMAMSGLAGGFAMGGERMLGIIADRMFSGVSGFLLIAVPYFIFTAELMNQGGLTHKLIAFNNALFGRVRGSLSHVNISVSVFFAGLTGAAVTDTVAIGKIMIPEMKKTGLRCRVCRCSHRLFIDHRADYSPQRRDGGLRHAAAGYFGD